MRKKIGTNWTSIKYLTDTFEAQEIYEILNSNYDLFYIHFVSVTCCRLNNIAVLSNELNTINNYTQLIDIIIWIHIPTKKPVLFFSILIFPSL